MNECCLCSEAGVYYSHDRWWCYRHYDVASEEIDDISPQETNQKTNKSQVINIGLKKIGDPNPKDKIVIEHEGKDKEMNSGGVRNEEI